MAKYTKSKLPSKKARIGNIKPVSPVFHRKDAPSWTEIADLQDEGVHLIMYPWEFTGKKEENSGAGGKITNGEMGGGGYHGEGPWETYRTNLKSQGVSKDLIDRIITELQNDRYDCEKVPKGVRKSELKKMLRESDPGEVHVAVAGGGAWIIRPKSQNNKSMYLLYDAGIDS